MATDLMAEVVIPVLDPDTDPPTNRWYFHSSAVGGVSMAAEQTNIVNFYNSVPAGATNSVSAYMSKAIDRTAGATQTRWYDIGAHLSGSPHGPPIHIDFWQFGPVGTDAHTAQLAIVADYHGDLTGVAEFAVGSRPRARHRGRHYLGPLSSSGYVPANAAPWDAKLTSVAQIDIPLSYAHFLSSVAAGDEWCVWSRKDAALYPVVGGWVDRTIHIQRRRQDPAGVKLTWP